MNELRDYQKQALQNIHDDYTSGYRSLVVSAATGTGKTQIFSRLPEYMKDVNPGRTLVLAHRTELIDQAIEKLKQANPSLKVGKEMAADKADHDSDIIVASVQTLGRKGSKRSENIDWNSISTVIIDECFPPNTLIGDKPIQNIRVGDVVPTFDEKKKRLCLGLVTRIFRKQTNVLVRITTALGSVVCTPNHPFYTKKGWKNAGELNPSDVVYMVQNRDSRADQMAKRLIQNKESSLLQSQVWSGLHRLSFDSNDGTNKSEVCISANENQQPNESSRSSRKNEKLSRGDWASTVSPRRQRTRADSSRNDVSECPKLANKRDSKHTRRQTIWVSNTLQTRYSERRQEDLSRDRRLVSLQQRASSTRQKERELLTWVGLDRVEILERRSNKEFEYLCPNGTVYNIEVKGTHTYVANSFVVHNCHHSTSQTYLNIMELAGVLGPDSKKLLIGFTATPQRSDGKALAAIYKKISYVYGLRPAIKDGWLCDIKAFRVDTRTDISNIATSGGDFKTEELADKINNPERNQKIVETWKNVANGRQTVIFCANIAHSQAVAEEFSSEGISAASVWGNDPERAVKLAKYASGELQVLTNCEVLTEGWDSPKTSCIVLARPTKSPVLFTQMCGRGTRLAENKQDCLIIDVMDVSGEHSLCTVPTLMGLDSGLDLCGRSLIKSVEEIESAQEANPNIDFMKMKKITDLKSYIESINLFEVRFPLEAEQNSDFKWCQAAIGGFRLSVPKGRNGEPAGFVHIQQNMLDKWDIKGAIRGTEIVGQRNTMEEAFAAADNAIRTRAEGSVHLVDRKSSWNNDPATVNQFTLLRRLYGSFKKWPDNLTKGQAAHFIDQKIAKRGVK